MISKNLNKKIEQYLHNALGHSPKQGPQECQLLMVFIVHTIRFLEINYDIKLKDKKNVE